MSKKASSWSTTSKQIVTMVSTRYTIPYMRIIFINITTTWRSIQKETFFFFQIFFLKAQNSKLKNVKPLLISRI
jgi:hypothetical protein